MMGPWVVTQKGSVRLPERPEPRFLGWSEPAWLGVHLGFIFGDGCSHAGWRMRLRTMSSEGGGRAAGAAHRGPGGAEASVVTQPHQHWGPASWPELPPAKPAVWTKPALFPEAFWNAERMAGPGSPLVGDAKEVPQFIQGPQDSVHLPSGPAALPP